MSVRVAWISGLLLRLERGASDETETHRLARLRSHLVALLSALDDAGVAFTPAAAAVMVRAALGSRLAGEG